MTVARDRFGGPVEVELLTAVALAENSATLDDDDGVGNRQVLVSEHLVDHGVELVLVRGLTPRPLVRRPGDVRLMRREARLY